MRRFVFCALVLGGLGTTHASMLLAQSTGSITGHVRDMQQHPIRGVTVAIPGSRYRAMTDVDGAYSLDSIPAGVYTIRYGFINYKPHELSGLHVVAGQRQIVDASLESEPATSVMTAGLVLRFQLIKAIPTRTTYAGISAIDSVLKDLFRFPGYKLLANAAVSIDYVVPRPGKPDQNSSEQLLSVNGDPYHCRQDRHRVRPDGAVEHLAVRVGAIRRREDADRGDEGEFRSLYAPQHHSHRLLWPDSGSWQHAASAHGRTRGPDGNTDPRRQAGAPDAPSGANLSRIRVALHFLRESRSFPEA